MRENKYDEQEFFDQYAKMRRSMDGLPAAGEWHEFQKLLPDLGGKAVLDLGCGYGWHCRYALEYGARFVVGIDLSERMLNEAKARTTDPRINYLRGAIEDPGFRSESFDLILSSLALHYVESLEAAYTSLYRIMTTNGDFVFSVEHPIFTAYGNQDWVYDQKGHKLYWPVDQYFHEGKREAIFLGQKVIKYHRTITTYLDSLVKAGFSLKKVIEPLPPESMLNNDEGMRDELRRPMILLVSAHKN